MRIPVGVKVSELSTILSETYKNWLRIAGHSETEPNEFILLIAAQLPIEPESNCGGSWRWTWDADDAAAAVETGFVFRSRVLGTAGS